MKGLQTTLLLLLLFISGFGKSTLTEVKKELSKIKSSSTEAYEALQVVSIAYNDVNLIELINLANWLRNSNKKYGGFLGNWCMTEYYIRKVEVDSAKYFLKRSEKFLNKKEFKSSFYNTKARAFEIEQMYDSSAFYTKRALEFAEDVKLKPLLLNNLSAYFTHLKQNDSAIIALLKSKTISEQIKDSSNLIGTERMLGSLFMEVDDLKKAAAHLSLALKLSRESQNEMEEAATNRQLGSLNTRLENFDEAISYHEKAVSYFKTNGPMQYYVDCLNSIAINYERSNRGSLGVPFSLKSIEVANRIGLGSYAKYLKITLLSCYINGNYSGKKILPLIEELRSETKKNSTGRFYVLGNESKYYKKQKYWEKLVLVLEEYIECKDSMLDKEKYTEVREIETKYQTEKKEKENLALKADKQKQANQMKLLGGGLGALLLSLGVFTFYYRRNKKQKDKIVVLQKELHHRVDNNLAIIDEFIDKSMDGVEDKAVLQNLSELQTRVGSINEVHSLLYQDKDVTCVNLHKYLTALSEQVQRIYDKQHVAIEVRCDERLTIDTQQSVHFGLMVNEFLTNSFKYAFAGIYKPKIEIRLKQQDGHLELEIKDNGTGFDEADVSSDSYGTRIMELLAQKLKASYRLTGKDGASLYLKIQRA